MRYTQTGKAVVRFRMATSERRGKDTPEQTEWHSITAWDQLAELTNKLVQKGSKVYVEGRIQTREYNDKEGNKRWSTEVVAREIVFLDAKGAGAGRGDGPHPADFGDEGGGPPQASNPRAGAGGNPRGAAPSNTGGGGEIPYADDEDIPF